MTKARRNALPGFGPTLGLTVPYLSLLVLIPLCGVFVKTATLNVRQTALTAGRDVNMFHFWFYQPK